jgi:hypothetical protein
MLEYLALIAENELLRIENEKYKKIHCTHIIAGDLSVRTDLSPAVSMEYL